MGFDENEMDHISAVYRATATKLTGLVDLVGGYCTVAQLQASASPFGRQGAPKVFFPLNISVIFETFADISTRRSSTRQGLQIPP